jgi:protein-disulfide isomerase-like protein with CxxC motif
MNPSDASVLTLVFDDLLSKFTLPAELTREFIRIFRDHSTHLELLNEIKLSRTLSNEGFPALVLQHDSTYHAISLDYKNPCTMLEQINACIAV